MREIETGLTGNSLTLEENNPPGWHDPSACETCAGTGMKVQRVNRRRTGRVSSVSFSLKDNCPDCNGTGFAK